MQQIVDAYRRVTPQPPFDRIPVFRKAGLPVWQEVEAIDPLRHVQRPRAAPHDLRAILEAEARRLARRALSLSRGSSLVVESLLEGLSGYSRARPRAFTAPSTPMNEPIQNARSITHLVLPLAAMKRVAHARGATLNDVALTILDAGVNRYLKATGRKPDHPLVALVPVSLRDESAREATTMVSAIWPQLGPVPARTPHIPSR